MPDAKRAAPDETTPEGDADEHDLEGLKVRGDLEGLLTLARAYRSGTAPGGRDLERCLATYRAAAELGSADADFAVALFHMSGGVVAQDLKEGTARLRAAAEKGSVPAKVYLANLYELGIHYKADKEKADVWYRNAARGAGVDANVDRDDDDEQLRAMAELGCARHVQALIDKGSLSEEDKARLLQRARAHGHGLRMKDEDASARPTFLGALEAAEPSKEAAVEKQSELTKEVAAPAPASEKKPKGASPSPHAGAMSAFAFALLFVATGIGAGYAATVGARELVAHGQTLPVIGARTDLVFPIVLAALGVLPTCLVYRFGTVAKALVAGAAMGGVGWVAWGTGQAALHADRAVQALAFGLAGFVPALFVLGLIGGAKRDRPRRRDVP
jgi:TPR repeat protein